MALQFLKHKWQRVTLMVLGAIALLVIAGVLFIDTLVAPKLEVKLKTELAKSTDSLYHISFGEIDLHILRGKVTIKDLKLTADTSVYKQLKKKGKAPNSIYNLRINTFDVSGVAFFKLYFNKKLDIGQITITKPELQSNQYIDKPKKPTKKDDSTLYQKIKKDLKMVRVGSIRITDANYKMSNYTQVKATHSELKKVNFDATDLLIDSATQTDATRTFYCRDITLATSNYAGKSADGLYTYKVRSLKLSTQHSRLSLGGVELQPVAAAVFFKRSKSDRFTLRLDSVTLHDFDYMRYQQEQSLEASRVEIAKGMFEVHSNYNGLLPTTDRLVTFPHWAIKNAVKAELNIDTLDMKRFDMTYKQLNKDAMKTGAVIFKNITARFTNLTNKKELIAKNNICTASLTSWFMGVGRFDITFRFNLADPNYSYSYKGHLAPMDMAAANPALMPLSLVKIASGRVKSLDFAVQSTQKTSTGKVTLLYNNLNVDVLRADYTKKSFLSTLVNSFIIKHDNPDDGSTTPRSANVVFVRPANYPFFRTVWLTILKGIKGCAGIGEAEEKKLAQQSKEENEKAQEKLLKQAKKDKEKADKEFKKQLEEKQEKAKKNG